MAKTELRKVPPLNNSTPIQALHLLWERANSAYNAVDEAAPYDDGLPEQRVKASWFRDGTEQLYRQAGHLQLSLLNEQPLNMIDAAILAGHICTHGSGIDNVVEKYREESFGALERAHAALFAFLATQASFRFDGWLAGTLRGAQREVALRTGRPDLWISEAEAA